MKGPVNPLKRMAILILSVLGLTYLGVLLLLVVLQRSFIYFPSKSTEPELLQIAKTQGVLPWRDGQGNLIGWKSSHSGALPANRLLVFHGNAGQAVHRDYFIDGFTALNDGALWEVFVLEYPGYGARAGDPTEPKILEAAETALKQLQHRDKRPVYLLGESLGSGVASQIAARHPDVIAGVFLITPFTSLVDVAARQYPVFPVRLLLRDRYASDKALKNYSGAVAILVAGHDTIVPTQLGQKLYDGYSGRKRLWIEKDAGHNSIDYHPSAALWREVSDFLLSHVNSAQ